MATGGGVCVVLAWICFIYIFLMVSKLCKCEFAVIKFRTTSNSRWDYEIKKIIIFEIIFYVLIIFKK